MERDDDDIIDLTRYLAGSDPAEQGAFSVYGGGGPGSRFALPVWRSVYLLRGDRGGVIAVRDVDGEVEPVFLLDLAADPVRMELPMTGEELLASYQDGTRVLCPGTGWAAVLLGEEDGRVFFTAVTGMDSPEIMLNQEARQDFLFLSGECAGLVFHWELGK